MLTTVHARSRYLPFLSLLFYLFTPELDRRPNRQTTRYPIITMTFVSLVFKTQIGAARFSWSTVPHRRRVPKEAGGCYISLMLLSTNKLGLVLPQFGFFSTFTRRNTTINIATLRYALGPFFQSEKGGKQRRNHP